MCDENTYEKWFAWRPVVVGDHWAWFRYVERRVRCWGLDCWVNYREIEGEKMKVQAHNDGTVHLFQSDKTNAVATFHLGDQCTKRDVELQLAVFHLYRKGCWHDDGWGCEASFYFKNTRKFENRKV